MRGCPQTKDRKRAKPRNAFSRLLRAAVSHRRRASPPGRRGSCWECCATSILDVATDGMAIDILNENERGFVNGLMWAFRTLGVSISAIFSSIIINNYGLGEAMFYLGLAIALIGILLFFIKETEISPKTKRKATIE